MIAIWLLNIFNPVTQAYEHTDCIYNSFVCCMYVCISIDIIAPLAIISMAKVTE